VYCARKNKIDDDEKPKKGCPIDVTLLYVESDYGIVGVYPVRGETNRVDAGAALTIELPPINATTIGVEGVILIATEARALSGPCQFHLSGAARPDATARGGARIGCGGCHLYDADGAV
jgi:hypothetical protein